MNENRETRWPKADGRSLEPVAVVDQLPDPVTGELHPATPDRAAFIRLQAADQIKALRELQRICDEVLWEEGRRQGTKTLHLAQHDVILSGGETRVYDPIELRQNLRSVGCPEERIDQLVVETVEWRVNHSVRRQLAGANEKYAQAIELASHIEQRTWRATVK